MNFHYIVDVEQRKIYTHAVHGKDLDSYVGELLSRGIKCDSIRITSELDSRDEKDEMKESGKE